MHHTATPCVTLCATRLASASSPSPPPHPIPLCIFGCGCASVSQETALDVDVINTSFLDDNVPQLRHINLPANVHVVDDLREIIATRQRANQRRR
eukprot:783866-Prymnesium_polylepis.1